MFGQCLRFQRVGNVSVCLSRFIFSKGLLISRLPRDREACREAHMKLAAGLEVEDHMNQELLIQQTKVESQALEHITRALEVMIGWAVDGDGYGRKLSSVRFFTVQYQQHLERLFALEEIDGYMESVSRFNPELIEPDR